ncbi:MAG: prepilin-type N-terminal cleavage/methylation domain-containing protein [Thermoanaerobaculia bacterium]
MATSRRTGRQTGFTLIEMVVSLLVMSLVLALGLQVLLETRFLLMKADQEIGRPMPQLFARLLRRDAQGAAGIFAPQPTWTIQPLVLQSPDGTRVRYQRNGGNIDRQLFNESNELINTRTLMQNVNSWQWRRLAPGLLEVQIVYLKPRAPTSSLAPGLARLREGGIEPEILSLRYALRARPGRRSW